MNGEKIHRMKQDKESGLMKGCSDREAKEMINAQHRMDASAPLLNPEAALRTLYLEALQLVERLHRRLLDVIKDEFDRNGRSDINATQALLLFNIGNSELTAGELRSRGYYPLARTSLIISRSLLRWALSIMSAPTPTAVRSV
jgi:hypothetical protein